MTRPLADISDDDLLHELASLLRQSRRVEADLVAHIGEVDARRLFRREACPSMFAYCTEALGLSEAEAYLRITVARASREHPPLLTMLREGRLHLSALARLAPHLTVANRAAVLGRAVGRSKRQIEALIAELAPRPDAAAVIRRLPQRRVTGVDGLPNRQQGGPAAGIRSSASPGVGGSGVGGSTSPERELVPERVRGSVPSPGRPAAIEALALARYKVQFTASAAFRDKIERLKELMRSSVPDGDLAAVIEVAVTEKLERLEARRFAKTTRHRPVRAGSEAQTTSRHIPAAVRRAVHERDGDRCSYASGTGRRCSARGRLEYHHRLPFAVGGKHTVAGVSLVCKAHNRYLAEVDYGREAMARYARARAPAGEARAGEARAGEAGHPQAEPRG
jgi:5-methylcytosine-specific restriction endonuclease McrA